jgi:simple sugar transport system substrate-binding protein
MRLPTLALSALLLAGCAAPPADGPGGKPLRLVFITCAVDAPFFVPVKQGMRDAARMLDVTCTFTGTPGVDVKAQAEMVRRAAADGVDGIALNIIDPVAFDAAVQEAVKAGVPVVAFNVDDHATPNARLAAVCQRFPEAGRALARHVAPHLPRGSRVLFTQHDKGVSALDERLRGLREGLKERGVTGETIVTGNVSTKGAEAVAAALRKDLAIRAVLGTGQSDTEAAGLAIEKHFAGRGIWSAGFDMSPTTLRLIRTGHIRATVDQQPYVQGFLPVVMLAHHLRYGLRPSDVDAGAAIIDRANVDRVEALTRRGYR